VVRLLQVELAPRHIDSAARFARAHAKAEMAAGEHVAVPTDPGVRSTTKRQVKLELGSTVRRSPLQPPQQPVSTKAPCRAPQCPGCASSGAEPELTLVDLLTSGGPTYRVPGLRKRKRF